MRGRWHRATLGQPVPGRGLLPNREWTGCLSRGAGAGQTAELHSADFRMWLGQHSPHGLSICACVHVCTQTHALTYMCTRQTQRHNHGYTYMYGQIGIHAHTHAHTAVRGQSWARHSHWLSLTLSPPPPAWPGPLAAGPPLAPLPHLLSPLWQPRAERLVSCSRLVWWGCNSRKSATRQIVRLQGCGKLVGWVLLRRASGTGWGPGNLLPQGPLAA